MSSYYDEIDLEENSRKQKNNKVKNSLQFQDNSLKLPYLPNNNIKPQRQNNIQSKNDKLPKDINTNNIQLPNSNHQKYNQQSHQKKSNQNPSFKNNTYEDDRASNINSIKPNDDKTHKNNDQYQEEFEDDYEEDFQEVDNNQKINNKNKSTPKIPVKGYQKNNGRDSKQDGRDKLGGLRNHSKKSSRSIDGGSKRQSSYGYSKADFIPNKYKSLIQKQFPQGNPTQQAQEKLLKQNEKIRKFIKKFNDQLNALIDKNLLQLKAKKQQKVVNVQDRIKLLEEEKKNNLTMIQRMENQYGKLQGKEGYLKQQQNHILLQEKANELKQQIKQVNKVITKLNVQVNNEGNKLTKKVEQNKIPQQLANMKNNIAQIKKEEEKGIQRLQKLQQKVSQLNEKLAEVQLSLKQKLDLAKQKGISIESKQQYIAKHQQIKKKKNNLVQYINKTEGLLKTKAQQVNKEIQQIRNSINNFELDGKKIVNNISNKNYQTVKAIQKALQNPRIALNTALARSLKQMKNQLGQQSSNLEENNGQRITPLTNLKKTKAQVSNSQNKISISSLSADQSNTNKPTLLKKKKNVESKNDIKQRVWKQEQINKQSQKNNHNKSDSNKQLLIFQNKKQDESKKPFNLKKNRISQKNSGQVKVISNQQIQINKKDQLVIKDQDMSLIPPKIIKFKKTKNEQNNKTKEEEKILNNFQKKQTKQEDIKQLQDQAIFAPKRLNLRNKVQKKDQPYVSTSLKKQNQMNKQQQITKKQQYKPNLNFKIDDNLQKKQSPLINNIKGYTQEQKKNQQNSKPLFNLKLKDHKKNQEGIQIDRQQKISPILDSQNKNKIGDKILNNQHKQNENSKNPYIKNEQVKNPYAKQHQKTMNQDVVEQKRNQRQGPIKKNKITANISRQKMNIYDQVEDLTKQPVLKNQQIKVNVKNEINKNSQQLNLNQMLGIKKENKKQQQDNLFGQPIVKANKIKKKNQDFFSDLNI